MTRNGAAAWNPDVTVQDEYDSPLDPGISDIVQVLRAGGVETFESCQGGEGHAYYEPTVRFHGELPEGLRALSVAMYARLPIKELRRVWPVISGEPTGPWWELTFSPTKGS
jgi:hypothetical protein